MPFSNYTHAGLLDSLFGKTSDLGALGSAPTIHVGLSTSTPTMAGGNITEPGGASYARVQTAASDWNAATDADPSVIDNANAVEFPQLTAGSEDWGTVTHFVLYDAATAGNVLGFGALDTSKNPTEGDTPRFAAGELNTEIGSPA